MNLYKMIEKKKKERKRKENIKIAKVATITTAVGVVSGILLAPKSGKETRNDIKDKTVEFTELAKVKANNAREVLNGKLLKSKKNLKEAKNKIENYLENKKIKDGNIEEVENTEKVDCDIQEVGNLDL